MLILAMVGWILLVYQSIPTFKKLPALLFILLALLSILLYKNVWALKQILYILTLISTVEMLQSIVLALQAIQPLGNFWALRQILSALQSIQSLGSLRALLDPFILVSMIPAIPFYKLTLAINNQSGSATFECEYFREQVNSLINHITIVNN